MIILGIDPGTTRAGFGVIEKKQGKLKLIEFGLIEIKGQSQIDKLLSLGNSLESIIDKFKPEVAGIESLFFAKNKKTALSVAEARGVIIFNLAKKGVPIYEFSPNNIKSTVSGYGKSDKQAMERIVSLNLNIKDKKLPDDAFDALAIAIRASFEIKLN